MTAYLVAAVATYLFAALTLAALLAAVIAIRDRRGL